MLALDRDEVVLGNASDLRPVDQQQIVSPLNLLKTRLYEPTNQRKEISIDTYRLPRSTPLQINGPNNGLRIDMHREINADIILENLDSLVDRVHSLR